jgi:CO/xanthine dehydrogenase FAD-binding subunit
MSIDFDYAKASSLANALKLLEGRKDAYCLAGGTDLLLKIKHSQLKPGLVVGIGRLEELQFTTQSSGYVRIGAGVKLNELLKSTLLKENAALLLKAAAEIGSPEVRNMATIGGNICCAGANCGACGLPGCRSMSGGGVAPCKYASFADLIPPLLVLEAGLLLVSAKGERTVSLREFLRAPKKAKIKTGEILKEIHFKPHDGIGWGYARLSTAAAMGIPVIAVAMTVSKNSDNTCRAISLAVGGSTKEAVRMDDLQSLVEDKVINEEILNKIIQTSAKQMSFTENLYMSIDYRKAMTAVLIRDAMQQALGSEL